MQKLIKITKYEQFRVLNKKIGNVEIKIPDINGVVKKVDYGAKISDIKNKYFATSDYNKFSKEIDGSNIKEKKLVDQYETSNFVKIPDLNTKPATLATKAEL